MRIPVPPPPPPPPPPVSLDQDWNQRGCGERAGMSWELEDNRRSTSREAQATAAAAGKEISFSFFSLSSYLSRSRSGSKILGKRGRNNDGSYK